MAKLMIATLALVAMIGSIGASPVIGLLGKTSSTQAQGGLLGGLQLGGNLNLGIAAELLATVTSLIQTTTVQKIREETDAGATAVANSAAIAAYQAKKNGLTREEARPIVEEAAMRGAEPVVRRVIIEGARVAIENAYRDNTPQGLAQGQNVFGRK